LIPTPERLLLAMIAAAIAVGMYAATDTATPSSPDEPTPSGEPVEIDDRGSPFSPVETIRDLAAWLEARMRGEPSG
jgi:hypothetical protein